MELRLDRIKSLVAHGGAWWTSTSCFLMVGGVALGASLAWSGVWLLSILGAAILLYAIDQESRAVHRVRAALLFSMTAYSLGLVWAVSSAWPFSWAGEGNTFLLLLFSLLAHGAWALSLAIGFSLVWGIRVQGSAWVRGVQYAALWVLAEAVASLSMSLVVFGAEAGPHVHMTLHMAGFGVASSLVLAQFASVGGVHLLSAGVASAGWLLVLLARKEVSAYRTGVIVGAAYCVGALLYAHAIYQEEQATRFMPIIAPSTNLEVGDSAVVQQQKARSVLEAIDRLSPPQGTTLLLPERIRFMYVQDTDIREQVELVLGRFSSIIEQRTLNTGGGETVSVIEVYYPEKKVVDIYTKELLVPLGEYLPSVVHVFFSALGREDLLRRYTQERNFRAQVQESRSLPTLQGAAVKSCYEVISSSLYRTVVAHGATHLVNTASHSTFYGNPWAFSIAERAARLRAIETRRFYVQATNMGPSIAIRASGDVAEKNLYPGIFVQAPILTQKTVYVQFGEWVFWASLLVVVFFSTRALRRTANT